VRRNGDGGAGDPAVVAFALAFALLPEAPSNFSCDCGVVGVLWECAREDAGGGDASIERGESASSPSGRMLGRSSSSRRSRTRASASAAG
jgi:hypothetical protein